MEFARINKESLIHAYLNEQKSCKDIAAMFATNATKIRKALLFLGVKIRNYAEAQKLCLSQGKTKHPTAGTKRDKETLLKISESASKAWKDMPEERKKEIASIRKENWEAMSVEQRESLRDLAHKAIRNSAEIGSKTERYVSSKLEDEGYSVIIHARNLIQSTALEVDMFIPALKTAVEIDGPSHFLPIWGEDKLLKQEESDSAKQGLLLNAGYVMIRVRQLDKSLSRKRMDDIANCVIEELKSIEENFPAAGYRLIEIEVKDGRTTRLSKS
jgi:hypothetical protein